MKFRSFSTLLVLFFCASMMAQTTAERAGERAKNRAENRANQRVDQKVDRAVDDAFNAVGNLFKKKKKKTGDGAESTEPTPSGTASSTSRNGNEAGGADAIDGLFGGNSDPWVPFTNTHSFSYRMEVVETKKNGKQNQSVVDIAVTSNRVGMRMQDEDGSDVSRMILNTEDGKTTIITTENNGKTSGMRMRMPGIGKAIANASEDIHERFTFNATGERKVIDGYNCEKVIVTDTEKGNVTESWVTQDIDMDAQEAFSSLMGLFGSGRQRNNGASSSLSGAFKGFPIMSTSTQGKSTYETHFTNIKVGVDKVDRSVLSTEGIQIQEIGF